MEPQHTTAPTRRGRRQRTRRLVSLGAATVLALGGGSLVALPSAQAGEAPPATTAQDTTVANDFQRGPDPTEDSIEAVRGHYDVATERVRSIGQDFGGGTIHYPTTTEDGTFGVVAICPGFTASENSIEWLGPRIASQGFVVITMDTETRLDQPGSRGDQLLAALDYVIERSDVKDRVDGDRQAVMGHSMGGGGVLEAAKDRPSLKAGIPMTPWNLDKSWGEITTPMYIIGAEADTIASVRTHAIPFYESLPSSTDRAYMELDNATHFAPNISNTTIAKYSISWLKRFVDEDERYEQFLCPLPDDREISDMRGNCPH